MNHWRKLEWLAVAATAGLLLVLKYSHLGVLHYNWFMLILIAWGLSLLVFFRCMAKLARQAALAKLSLVKDPADGPPNA